MALFLQEDRKYLHFFILVCSVIAFLSFTRFARASGDFEISPMLQEVAITNGEIKKEVNITLTNTTHHQVFLTLSAVDFQGLDASGGVAFLGSDQSLGREYTLAPWIHLETDSLVLNPGEERAVDVTIENRDDLSPGGHYGAVLFRNAPQDDVTNIPHVALSQVFTSLFFVKKEGGEKPALDLTQWTRESHWFSVLKEEHIQFTNSGNVHVVPRGEIEIRDFLWRLVGRGILNDSSFLILPKMNRVYRVKPFLVRYPFSPGLYTITLRYHFDGDETTREEMRRVWYVPLVSIGILGVSLLLLFGSWRVRRVLVKKHEVK